MGCALLNEQDKFMTLVIKNSKVDTDLCLNNYGKHCVGLDNYGKQKLRHKFFR